MALVESFSGIRGIFGIEITEGVILNYARAYSEFLRKTTINPRIVIGRDTRESGEFIFNLLVRGLDAEIINVGISTTPIIENAVRAFNADGGIIITASHNEPEFNGFKFLDKTGCVLNPEDSDFVIKRANGIFLDIETKQRKIENKKKQSLEEYIVFLNKVLGCNKINSSVKILVDPNGGSGIISKEIFDKFGISAKYINMNGGEFNRLIEPNESSLKYLKEKIQDFDFALGFDCDADRVEILLKNGRLVSGNEILALIVKAILPKLNDSEKTIVANDATSYLVKEVSEKYHGKWQEVEVGETNVVNKMIELNSKVGGEGSNGGIIIYPSRCRDGILTILFLIKLMSEENRNLLELIEELPRYCYLKEKFKLDKDFSEIREKVKQYYLQKEFKILETGTGDGGLKFIKDNSWVWFRQSKTESRVLRVIVDSKDFSNNLIEEARRLLSSKERASSSC